MLLPFLFVASVAHAKAALRTEVAEATPGHPFLVAVEIRTDPHWHVYWRNPGDSGIPTKIAWSAPKGWRVQPLEMSVPRRFSPGGVTAYGYEGDTLFFARVTPSNVPGSVVASVKWLVCSEACIAGGSDLKAPIRIGAKIRTTPWAPSLRTAAATLPRPAEGWAFRATETPKGVTLEAKPPTGKPLPSGVPTFFPFETGLIDHAQVPVATLQGDRYVLTMKASPFPEGQQRLSGLFVAPSGKTWPGGRTAVVVDARLEDGDRL